MVGLANIKIQQPINNRRKEGHFLCFHSIFLSGSNLDLISLCKFLVSVRKQMFSVQLIVKLYWQKVSYSTIQSTQKNSLDLIHIFLTHYSWMIPLFYPYIFTQYFKLERIFSWRVVNMECQIEKPSMLVSCPSLPNTLIFITCRIYNIITLRVNTLWTFYDLCQIHKHIGSVCFQCQYYYQDYINLSHYTVNVFKARFCHPVGMIRIILVTYLYVLLLIHGQFLKNSVHLWSSI